MDEREWLSLHETGTDPVTNVIEPDLSLEIKPDRHSATGRPLFGRACVCVACGI